MSLVLSNFAGRTDLAPTVEQAAERHHHVWNRLPRTPLDVPAWRRRAEENDALGTVPRQWLSVAEVDAGLATWVRTHLLLQPVQVEDGESGGLKIGQRGIASIRNRKDYS